MTVTLSRDGTYTTRDVSTDDAACDELIFTRFVITHRRAHRAPSGYWAHTLYRRSLHGPYYEYIGDTTSPSLPTHRVLACLPHLTFRAGAAAAPAAVRERTQ